MPEGLKPLGALVLLLSGACGLMTQSQRMAAYDRDIENATKAIETARDDGERASRYAERGRVYSEKARYSKTFKLIADDEYGRLFDLAIEDHDRAIALAPDNARPSNSEPPRMGATANPKPRSPGSTTRGSSTTGAGKL